VCAYAESEVSGGAAFPPAPLSSEVSGPVYGNAGGSLEYWKRRHFSSVSWSAVEMLYSERQMAWFRGDMDVPASRGAKAQAQAGGEGGEGSGPAAAAADGAGGEARPSS
jgi:hypothetical protein